MSTVRLVKENRDQYGSQWTAVDSIAPKVGCVSQTLLTWVRHQEIDSGKRNGITTAEAQRVKEFEREVIELCRANEIRKFASAFSRRQNSTAASSREAIRRRTPRHVSGRADLQSAADCPIGLPAPRGTTTGSVPEPARVLRDAILAPQIEYVWQVNMKV